MKWLEPSLKFNVKYIYICIYTNGINIPFFSSWNFTSIFNSTHIRNTRWLIKILYLKNEDISVLILRIKKLFTIRIIDNIYLEKCVL